MHCTLAKVIDKMQQEESMFASLNLLPHSTAFFLRFTAYVALVCPLSLMPTRISAADASPARY